MARSTDYNPGKYDYECTIFRAITAARGVVVMVFDGSKGEGFSVQAEADIIQQLPRLLRHMANQIEQDLQEEKQIN